jgi:hypothetical protein
MMLGEVPGERILERREFGTHPAPSELGQRLRVGLPGDQRRHHLPAGHPEDVAGDYRHLDLGVFEQLLHPLLLRGARLDQINPIPGHITQPPNLRGWHETRAEHLPLATLHNHTASSRSVLGRPGRCFTSRALTSHV